MAREKCCGGGGGSGNGSGGENVREGFASAGAHAGFQDAFEIAALAVAGGSSSGRDRENYAGGGPSAAAYDAAWIICAQFAGPGKIGVDRGTAGQAGGRREYRVAGIDRYASAGGIPDEPVFSVF